MQSIQNQINKKMMNMNTYLSDQELVQVDKYSYIKKGTRIAYVRTDTLFRSGGFLIEKNDIYLLYRGFNTKVFSLQINDIKLLFIDSKNINEEATNFNSQSAPAPVKAYVPVQAPSVQMPAPSVIPVQNVQIRILQEPKKRVLLNPLGKPTNFPVMFGKHVLYYARDNFSMKRFMNGAKYEQIMKGSSWEFTT